MIITRSYKDTYCAKIDVIKIEIFMKLPAIDFNIAICSIKIFLIIKWSVILRKI